MKRKSYKSYFFLLLLSFSLLSAPKSIVEEVRCKTLSFLTAPLNFSSSKTMGKSDQFNALQVENQLLKTEVKRLQELLVHQERLMVDLGKPHSIQTGADIARQLQLQLFSVPAQVVMRSRATWDSTLWINLGYKDNQLYSREVVAVNSPVIVGNTILGVIDYVSQNKSRVKLIGDPSLNLSVRAARQIEDKWTLLAKGEMQGKLLNQMRSSSTILSGTGFNYDFADEEGPARDLRTGDPLGVKGPPISIIEKNDLLVTTGMDGVFPKGFHVGKVTAITPLKEGDFYFDIEAESAAANINSLSLVWVLPPI